jgi:hypothetical protein
MTRHAVYRRKIVTPESFMAMAGPHYRERNDYPTCPSCKVRLEPYGVHSTKVQSRFDHPNGSVCPLSSTPDRRYAHLCPSDWDLEQGERLYAEFCRPENLKSAYMVCWAIIGKLTGKEFLRMCQQAVNRNIFSYQGLSLAILPYILVTLVDLPISKDREFPVRVVLSKPKGPIDDLWIHPEQCSLRFYFADTGRPMQRPELSIPCPPAEQARTNTGWISDNLGSSTFHVGSRRSSLPRMR